MGTTFDEVTTLGDVSTFILQENRNLFLAMPFTSSGMRTLAKLFECQDILGDEPYNTLNTEDASAFRCEISKVSPN